VGERPCRALSLFFHGEAIAVSGVDPASQQPDAR